MLTELRKETFGSDIALLAFSPKPDDNLLLIVSRDKPKLLFIVDWKRNELMYNIPVNTEEILSQIHCSSLDEIRTNSFGIIRVRYGRMDCLY